jgi:hypothetical protein
MKKPTPTPKPKKPLDPEMAQRKLRALAADHGVTPDNSGSLKRTSDMISYFCQMRIIGDGIWCPAGEAKG